ncbi:hypothetical protein ACFVJI_09745 [Streptomyces sp. NPDC127584]|uniref:hypothetical protein n=1 Tax=Streptomyces sp. NPDC127584 TaxID=3345403 RepID=UPI00362EF134
MVATLTSSTDNAGPRKPRTEFQHNCWKHDQDLLIRYTGVSGFVVVPGDENRVTELGTVILDEVLPHWDGCSHAIACWEGTLIIVCGDFRATWTEATCSSRS